MVAAKEGVVVSYLNGGWNKFIDTLNSIGAFVVVVCVCCALWYALYWLIGDILSHFVPR